MHFGVQGRSQAIASTLDCTRDFPTALGQLKYRDDPDRSRAAALDRRAQSPRLLRRAAADTKCLTPVWRTTPSYSLQTKKVTAKCARPVRSRRRPQGQSNGNGRPGTGALCRGCSLSPTGIPPGRVVFGHGRPLSLHTSARDMSRCPVLRILSPTGRSSYDRQLRSSHSLPVLL